MKNYLRFVFLIGFAIATSAWQNVEGSRVNAPDRFKARQMLVECFASLDLQSIIEQNSDYFEQLGAGYDADNRRFFIEWQVAGYQYNDDSLLILISYPQPQEAEICIYAPEVLSWQWLRSRIRQTDSCINSPILFEPMLQPDDLIPCNKPAAASHSQLAFGGGKRD